MDASRFAARVRNLTGALSRRFLVGFVLGGAVAGTGLAVAGGKNKKKNTPHKRKCGPCKTRKNGTCKPKPNGTPCGDGGTCQSGKCQEPPESSCAETCDGCCDGTTCAPGDADGACGQGGEICAGCKSGGSCCGGVCCEGCCFENQCYAGNHIERCGAGGVACAECPIEEICTADRICAPPTCGNGGPCLVFITSVTGDGSFGGLAGADAACQFLAQEHALPGTYRAWLADDTGSPSTRFMQSPGPYTLINETIVANDWADLTDGSLQAAINRTEEDEQVLAPFETWTNTNVDGTVDDILADCGGWTTDNGVGSIGSALVSTADWTAGNPFQPCGIPAHLYCVQQS